MLNRISKYLIYYPATFLRGENVFLYLNEIKNTFKFSKNQLNEYQNKKMVELAGYLYKNTLYYRKMFENKGLQEKDLSALCDIKIFNIMTKNEIRKHYYEMQNKNIRQYWRSTSGTTGQPFKFQKDSLASGYMDAVMYEAYSWHGVKIGDKQGRIWGTALEPRRRLIQRTVDYILNRKRLSTFNMNSNNCIKFAHVLSEFKVEYLYGYVNGIYEFVEIMKRTGQIWNKKLKCIIVTGEVLFNHQRNAIEEYFGAKCVSEYGTTENGVIGFECEYQKLHIVPTVFLEVVDKDENGYGEILITELFSRSIPFIRYKVGDVGKLIEGKCECGRSMPILELKKGRIDSFIRLPDGSSVYDAILAYALKNFAISFRGYQKEIQKIIIEIVPKGVFTKEKKDVAEKKLRKHLGNKINIEFTVKEHIEKERSGKLRYFIPLDN